MKLIVEPTLPGAINYTNTYDLRHFLTRGRAGTR